MRFHAELSMEDKVVDAVVGRIQQAVEKTIATEIQKLKVELPGRAATAPPPAQAVPRGVDLAQAERVKAADLRTAIPLGKIPEDTGLLIDVKTTAKLLNVSERMV